MFGYCWDVYYAHLEAEYQASCGPGEHRPATELAIPLRWILAWVGCLSLVGLGLGSAIRWLLA
jgi:hypothetical protein